MNQNEISQAAAALGKKGGQAKTAAKRKAAAANGAKGGRPAVRVADIEVYYHHMPSGSGRPQIGGMTLRDALAALRAAYFGSMGGMHPVELSDGTLIAVELKGGETHSQRIVRYGDDGQILRTYKL